ncbi:hypothetical protein ACHQM5_024975 [Ranunculus cassubicifolius]
MLAADAHLGTKNRDFQMEQYLFRRKTDCILIINLGNPQDKLRMAARVIVQSARLCGHRLVLKFLQYTGAHPIAGRHTSGTFTNQMQTSFSEPHLLILTDPGTDHQPIKEAALGNIPTIAFCDTDSRMRYADTGIPAKNKGNNSIGCLFWLLARVVWQISIITIAPGKKWKVMIDLFLYIEPEEAKEQEEDAIYGSDYPNEYTLALGAVYGLLLELMLDGVVMFPRHQLVLHLLLAGHLKVPHYNLRFAFLPADGGWGDAVADAPIAALPVDGIPAAPIQATG